MYKETPKRTNIQERKQFEEGKEATPLGAAKDLEAEKGPHGGNYVIADG